MANDPPDASPRCIPVSRAVTADQPFRPRAYSPEDVAELWACSADHVRKLVRTGALPSFRLGGKLIRIKPEDVEAFERRNAVHSDPEPIHPSAPAMKASAPAAFDLREYMRNKRRMERLSHLGKTNSGR